MEIPLNNHPSTFSSKSRSRDGWHEHREGGSYVLARHWPPRFDIEATAEFPPVSAARLARQVRQDMWRELQHLRGFSPVVGVDATEDAIMLRAGGRTIRPIPAGTAARLHDLLHDPRRRARWIAWAGKGRS